MTGDNQSDSTKVQFIERHKPALESGDYTITVEQHIVIQDKSVDESFKLQQQEQKFSILGPRFSLDPQIVQAVFPSSGNLGENSNVLPHIILDRSTLPWERLTIPLSPDELNALAKDDSLRTKAERELATRGAEKQKVPWLALLLFDIEDVTDQNVLEQIKTPNSWKLSELSASTVNLPKSPKDGVSKQYNVHFPTVNKESGDHPDDQVAVIDVPKTLVDQILPSLDELKSLAHVRQTLDQKNKAQGDEVAVIICSRLPKSGSMNIVHLVSIEGRYTDQGFDDQGAADADLIRLVSLFNWRFACVSEKQTFKGLLMHLNHQLLFNLKAGNYPDALNNKQIPKDLLQAFEQSKHPLETNAIVKDRSQWKLLTGSTYFIISDNRNIYNSGGKFLFALDAAAVPRPSDSPQKVSQKIRDDFATNQHVLSADAQLISAKDHWWLATGTKNSQYYIHQENDTLFVYHLDRDSSSTLRLPDLVSDHADIAKAVNHYYVLGSVPLPHAMRQGNKSVSWYHGPLIPGSAAPKSITLPVRSADELTGYDSIYGMFDISYAAAWELGRLLTLKNKSVSISLFNWKRANAQSIKDVENQIDHLPFRGPSANLNLPDNVRKWFDQLTLLRGIPFNYLVPDERMLPAESIRYFQVDPSWMECLRDGAFSIGRVLASDYSRDHQLMKAHIKTVQNQLSGFLLRSDVVAGWPGLLVDGYGDRDAQNQLTPIRMERLSKNVLFCLFKGIIQTVDIHQKPETLHFGVSEPDDDHPGWYKTLKDENGQEKPNAVITIPFKADKNVIDIASLIKNMQIQTSSEFALQMIEGVEKVRFIQR